MYGYYQIWCKNRVLYEVYIIELKAWYNMKHTHNPQWTLMLQMETNKRCWNSNGAC